MSIMIGIHARSLWLHTVSVALLLTVLIIGLAITFDLPLIKLVMLLPAMAIGLFVASKIASQVELALAVLILLVWTNLSQVLDRFHGIPGIFHLTLIFVFIAILREIRNRRLDLRNLSLLWLPVVAYSVLPLFSSTIASNPLATSGKAGELLKVLTLFSLVMLLVNSPTRIRIALWSISISAAVLSLLGMLQLLSSIDFGELGGFARIKHAHIYDNVFSDRLAGPIGDPGFFGQLLVLSTPFPMSLMVAEQNPRLKLMAFICLSIIVVGVGLTYSRGPLMVLFFIFTISLFSFRLARWQHIPLLVVAALLIFALLPNNLSSRLDSVTEMLPGQVDNLHPDSSVEHRRLFGRTAVAMFEGNPLAGVGVGNFSTRYEYYSDRVGSDARHYGDADEGHFAHNLYYETAAETGLIGLLLLATLFFSALWSAQDSAAWYSYQDRFLMFSALALRNSVFAYLLTSTLLHGDFQRYIFVVLGLIAALASMRHRQRQVANALEQTA